MNLRPLGDRVIIRPLRNPAEQNFENRTGLVVPDSAKNLSYWGIVLEVGPGKPHYVTGEIVPPKLSVGETVLFAKYAGYRYQLPGEAEELVAIEEKDVIGVQRED